jgi:hypothetical protein
LETVLPAEKRTADRTKRRAPPLTLDGVTGLPVRAEAPRQRTPLKRLDDVKRELGRVYRAMKSGAIPHEDGTKRAYVLDQIGKVIQMADIERRLDALEKQQTKLLPGAIGRQAGE